MGLTAHRLPKHMPPFEGAHPAEILAWTWREFHGRSAASSSFQTQSVPLLHLIATNTPQMPVLFLDTGFHFPETLAFKDLLVRELDLNVISLKPRMGHKGFQSRYSALYRSNPDMCCYINKVEPMEQALPVFDAWITGIRHDQTTNRSQEGVVSVDSRGLCKINPMLGWTDEMVQEYMDEHSLPRHPLTHQGYPSIGCEPCTTRVADLTDPRAGRWQGVRKTECGLHWDYGSQPNERNTRRVGNG